MNFLGGARAALGIADNPAHGVAGGDGAGADELLAVLQRDVGDLAGRRIDLVERPAGERIDLDRVDEAVAHRLNPRGCVGLVDAHGRVGGFRCRLATVDRLQLPGQRQQLGQLHDLDRRWRIDGELCRRRAVVIDVGRNEIVRAAAERGHGHHQSREADFTESRICSFPALLNDGETRSRTAGFHRNRRGHCPSSFDQLMAVT